MQALIVGAGIGGLTAALTLHAIGVDVMVVESASEIRPVGVGINVQPEAIRELSALGLADRLADTAVATTELVFFDHHGERRHSEPRGLAAGYDWPQYSIRRGDLQLLLLETTRQRINGRAVRTDVSFRSARPSVSGVTVELESRCGGAIENVDVDLLIGADGIHSSVCRWLHPQSAELRWSGTWMWRGIIETEPIVSTQTMIHVNDGTSTRLVAYPVSKAVAERGRSLTNWVCQVCLAAPQPINADWTRTTLARASDVVSYYEDWSTAVIDVPALLSRTTRILSLPMVDREPLGQWRKGRVSLLGDAAHPMYPVGANGATQAIVDAAVLARCLASHNDVEEGLCAYESARGAATAAIVMANREMDRAERSSPDMQDIDYRGLMSRYRHDTNAEPRHINDVSST